MRHALPAPRIAAHRSASTARSGADGTQVRMKAATMRSLVCACALWCCACMAIGQRADPASDAPEARTPPTTPLYEPASYDDALARWRGADDVNAWIGARFQYDMARALRLSETQRARHGRLPIHAPDAFFAAPKGVCVDLSRFAVETLRRIDPASRPSYLMIEFAPASIQGQVLRRHWVARFERDGQLFFFADSKRPGHIAGPYADNAAYIKDYAAYRGRDIVAFRDMNSTERKTRTLAARQPREDRR
jgi:hypothetical protein